MKEKQMRLAEAVREACVETARKAYDEAGVSGLCLEGRLEYAIDALRSLDLSTVIHQFDSSDASEKNTS
jgi:hypothetical protein